MSQVEWVISLLTLFFFFFFSVSSVSSSDGTAVQNEDYLPLSNERVSFLSGQSTIAIDVPILDDFWIEGSESFTVSVRLFGPSRPSASIGPRSSITVVIVDNDEICEYRATPILIKRSYVTACAY